MTQAIQDKATLDVRHLFVHIHSEHMFSLLAHFSESGIALLDPESHRIWLRVGIEKGMLGDQFMLANHLEPSYQRLCSVSSVDICLGLCRMACLGYYKTSQSLTANSSNMQSIKTAG